MPFKSKSQARAAFATMKKKHKLYKRSCKTGKRRAANGKASGGHDYTAGECSGRSHHSYERKLTRITSRKRKVTHKKKR